MMAMAPSRSSSLAPERQATQGLFALGLVVAGFATSGFGPAALVLALGFAYVVLTLRDPFQGLLLAVASLSISLQYMPVPGANLAMQGQKAAIFLALLLSVVRYGCDRQRSLPIGAYAAFACLSCLPILPHAPGPIAAIGALATLSFGWLAMGVNWPQPRRTLALKVVGLTPVISLMAGSLLKLAGTRDIWRHEFTGVLRLQGASIPAHFAFMCLGGIAAAALLARRGHRWARWLLAANLVLLLLSRTRASSLCGLAIATAYVLSEIKEAKPTARPLRLYCIGALGMTVIALVAPAFIQRTFGTSNGAGGHSFDTFGRTSAWKFYIDKAQTEAVTGFGLGSITSLDDGGIKNHGFVTNSFSVPHNEYIRAFAEMGLFGLGALLVLGRRSLKRVLQGCEDAVLPVMKVLVLAFVLLGLVDNTVSTPQFFLPFGLLLSLSQRPVENALP